MPSTIINGVDLYYETHGEGEPLALVAGLASDSQSWLPIIRKLSRQYRVITFDNRGSGRTKPQDTGITIQHIADDCMVLIRRLGLSSVNLLGHSMGGFVALDLAIRYPRHVSKLILAGTSAFSSERNNTIFSGWVSDLERGMGSKQWFRNMFPWIFSKRFFEDEEMLENAIQAAIKYPYLQTKVAFKNQVAAIKDFNCSEGLSGITAKTLVVNGKEDKLFSPEESARGLDAIPQAEFSFVEKAAHAIHIEKPIEFVNVVESFLDNSRRPA